MFSTLPFRLFVSSQGPTARLPGARAWRVPFRVGLQCGRKLADVAQRLRGDRSGDEQTAGGRRGREGRLGIMPTLEAAAGMMFEETLKNCSNWGYIFEEKKETEVDGT